MKLHLPKSGMAELTDREAEVLEFLTQGLSYKEIAGRLDISAHTVNSHIKLIYRKLKVQSRTQAMVVYLANFSPRGRRSK